MSRTAIAIAVLLVLVVLAGAGNLWASYAEAMSTKHQFAQQQAQQQAAGVAELRSLCADLTTMAQIQPPPGDPAANPSRAYEQAEHRAWLGLAASIRCPS